MASIADGALNPPTVDDLVGRPPRSLDEEDILSHFLGRSVDEIRASLRHHGEYSEDFMWMKPAGLRYYLPAVLDYLRGPESAFDFAMSQGMLCSLSFQYEQQELPADVVVLIRAVANTVDQSREKFDLVGEDALLEGYLRTIRRPS